MNILYAIQGTGNGHFSRAKEFIPYLSRYGKLDLLVSGSSVDVDLGYPIKYQYPGISYTFGKNGGIDILDTIKKQQPISFIDNMMQFEPQKYDLLISDYEPISAWACYRLQLPCIGLSHQASFLSKKTPRPDHSNHAAEFLFKYYAPCSKPVGFHYQQYDDFIFNPIIRSEVRRLNPVKKNHITVYLPAYSEEILLPVFKKFKSFEWHFFSKHTKIKRRDDNVIINPISNIEYLESLEGCCGLLTGGGFEAPAESIYLNKKLLVVPMHGQYEQQCNAEALRRCGVKVVQTIDNMFSSELEDWLDTTYTIDLAFPDKTEEIVEKIIFENQEMG